MNPHHVVPQLLASHLAVPELDLAEPDGPGSTPKRNVGQLDHATVTDCPRLGVWAEGRAHREPTA